MSEDLRSEAISILLREGYSRLEYPFKIGELEFELGDVFQGPAGTLSLVIVIDRPNGREEASRTYWLVQRVVRALDTQKSRRSVTVVIVGSESLPSRVISEIQPLARVLAVDGSLPTERLLAPLLRLRDRHAQEGISDAMQRLEKSFAGSRDRSDLMNLLSAADQGPGAVEASFIKWFDAALSARTSEE